MKYTKEYLEPLIKSSISWRQVAGKIGINKSAGGCTYLKKRAVLLEIDFSHFKGQGWAKNKKILPKKDIEDYLSNRISISSHNLKLRLFRDGIKLEMCEICGLTHWQGEKMVLELDHKNSNHFDNSLDNLQILCPNCHALETRKRRVAQKPKKKIPDRTHTRKVERPSKEVLLDQIKTLGYVGAGKKYGVSDNAIRKWLR